MSNYSSSKFVSDANTPWYKVLKMIPKKSTVLDVGCSSGNFGEVLIRENNCIVDGIEIDQGDALKAKKVLRRVEILNIETDDLSVLSDAGYDIIYFGDVIEHLVYPVKALERIKPKLKPSGSVVFSIPNMTHISVRIMLMGGRFQYGKTGLLDNTHLHYYDVHEIKRVFQEAGLTINKLDWVRRDVPTELLKKQLKQIGLSADSKFIKKSKSLEYAAYQFVGQASPSIRKTHNSALPPVSPPIDEFEKYLGEVKKDYQKIINDQDGQLKYLQNELRDIQNKLVGINNSASWKITKPLRSGKSLVGKLKQNNRNRT